MMTTRDKASGLLILAGLAVLTVAALKPQVPFHPVTPTMKTAAGAATGRRVTSLEAVGPDGRSHAPATEAIDRPLVLIFIQDGCPCSESAEPYFQALQAAYGARASFLGVIDGDLATARDWSARHGARHPILADPDKRIITACEAERSAYVMLVAPGGAIAELWPGYSASTLTEIGARLARLTGLGEVPLATEGAPTEMVSGCSF
ncbi:MAG: redoxin domain-containing protein [Paludisphaera borealis]|uniref:peroxiredoxin family protein n=1 Tax=Paludisphaera borealis TaxID=1387353 RepID=UPI00283E20D5|nr:redoxin domain-containing protein [Paludisphaera borealis]MDR3620601.1 redoxin domain-containing protein [Paludisphaera borealis]